MPYPVIPTQVKCPQCGRSFVAEITTIIDLGEDPERKERLLRGQINRAVCPDCGAGGLLSSPLLYHDPAKELLLTYMPPELGLSSDDQERFLGRLVTTVMDSLPPEQRKGYFLRPRTLLTFESLLDTILEADGISKEALQAQRRRMTLLNQFIAAVDDDATLDQLVAEHKAELNYEFFLLLAELIEAEREQGETDDAIERLRSKLLARVDLAVPHAAPADASYDQVADLLLESLGSDAWRANVALNFERLDYGFFQRLTARIDAAEGDERQRLTELREQLLQELDAIRNASQQAQDEAALLIMQLLEADDLAAIAAEHLREYDEAFFVVLQRYLRAAQQKGDTRRVERLQALMEAVRDAMESQLPPSLQLITRLARTKTPAESNAVLEAQRALLDDAFLQQFDAYLDSVKEHLAGEELARLQQIREQAQAKMAIQRG
ncbi:MAG: CpXC domain-containing protein [Anaerolineae bacterium]|jgi:ribosomal protein S27AE